ncbi:MAG: protein phosphatase 2C domain-containing protein [Prevotellaceae bacterium]|jgi:serine/threonine protein phosphatase PrpC|nr:protein phosphatase 2C domain-containing protein [Prevotellaceae bacterium]
MKIIDFLNTIIADANENEINDFLSVKEASIIAEIHKLWNEYKQNPVSGTAENQGDILVRKGEKEALAGNIDTGREVNNTGSDKDNIEKQLGTDDLKEPVNINEAEDIPLDIKINDASTIIIDMGIIQGGVKQEYNQKTREAAINKAFNKQIQSIHISLPNAKVNQEYNVEFDFEKLGIPEIGEIEFEGLGEIGLEYAAEEKRIKGMPTTAGDHKIKLLIKRKNWENGKRIFECNIILIINPDPRLLWNSIPTLTSISYYKPDSAEQFLEAGLNKVKFGKKCIVAASQRGRSHAHEGKPRDDDFAMFFDEQTGWYIMTVADGAGSAQFSRRGSQIACETVIEVCRVQLTAQDKDFDKHIENFYKEKEPKITEKRKMVGDSLYTIIGAAAFKAYKNIEKEAAGNNNPIKDYSTTLIISICKKFKFGWFVGAFWVGDGGIGIYDHKIQFLKVLGESDGGEYAGQTRFLTMPEVMQPNEIYRRLRFDIVKEDFTSVILMTDGITDPKFDTDANLNKIEKWNDLWADLSSEVNFDARNDETAGQLLKWLDFWSPGNHDDRTIAILY